MIPVVARTAEEAMRLVPNSMREAALALGITRWRSVIGVVIPGAITGIVTGIMLAVARIAGETAPLIFTAFGNYFGFDGLDKPIGALPLQIYRMLFLLIKTGSSKPGPGLLFWSIMVLIISIVVRWIFATEEIAYNLRVSLNSDN